MSEKLSENPGVPAVFVPAALVVGRPSIVRGPRSPSVTAAGVSAFCSPVADGAGGWDRSRAMRVACSSGPADLVAAAGTVSDGLNILAMISFLISPIASVRSAFSPLASASYSVISMVMAPCSRNHSRVASSSALITAY
ncbi:hypothetical protein OV079_50495 [Nannocystis pusilla]|uniref:Uncharacterized protein n=1 Tax=Nannocystis pusilla TaxID=889268 RepID=A0A9X3F0A9_9BACT|nr:hypothetical protein [Nannocystis pusilla]MCY1013628.1 hypothetical protein [Nannocystis pusilla]